MKLLLDRLGFLKRFVRAERGNFAVIGAFAMLPIAVATGGLLDYGRAMKVKSQLTATLDAAVLAAMNDYATDKNADFESIIKSYVKENLVDADKNVMATDIEVSDVSVTDEGELTAYVSASIGTDFLTLVGLDKFDVKVRASAMVGGSSLEVALVLDNTGSMGGSKIASLKSSAETLVKAIMPETGNDDLVKVALVPFAQYVNIGMSHRYEPGLDIPEDYTVTEEEEYRGYCYQYTYGWGWGWSWGTCKRDAEKTYKWYGCMASRPYNMNVFDDNYGTQGAPGLMSTSNNCSGIKEIKLLTTSRSEILTAINGMNASGYTYIPAGLVWGWRVLSDQVPFTDGVPYSDGSVRKAIVLMTDGENTRSMSKLDDGSTKNHEGEVYDHSSGSTSNANQITAEMCTNIKAEGIMIYTIAFDVNDGSSVQTLMKNCAGNGGRYFDADDSTELADAFKQIGISLLNLRLSK